MPVLPPLYFYKYRPWGESLKRTDDGACIAENYTARLLSECAIFCQQPRGFDDPHDGHTGAVPTGSEQDIDRYLSEDMAPTIAAMRAEGMTSLTQLHGSNAPEVQTVLRERAERLSRREQYICSFSAVADNDLMWSFYADQHRGICLEFDATHPFFAAARKVDYGEAPPARPLGATSKDPLLAHKSLAWAFQEEWRLLGNSRFLCFPPETLKRVILGYRFPEERFKLLQETLVSGRYRVVVDQMQRLSGTYQLFPVRRGEVGKV